MLGQSQGRWPNSETELGECLLFAGQSLRQPPSSLAGIQNTRLLAPLVIHGPTSNQYRPTSETLVRDWIQGAGHCLNHYVSFRQVLYTIATLRLNTFANIASWVVFLRSEWIYHSASPSAGEIYLYLGESNHQKCVE